MPKLKLRLRPSMVRRWVAGLLQSMKHGHKNHVRVAVVVVDSVEAAAAAEAAENVTAGN